MHYLLEGIASYYSCTHHVNIHLHYLCWRYADWQGCCAPQRLHKDGEARTT
jgi:hypothetical protein